MSDKKLKVGGKCKITGGLQKGKTGTIKDIKYGTFSDTTVTVESSSGGTFQTLAKYVEMT